MRYNLQAFREQLEAPFVDLARIDRTREGTVAIHTDREREEVIVGAANLGVDRSTLRAFARFTNGFHFVPVKDSAA